MALRSLFVKLKALPLRLPGSRVSAAAPKLEDDLHRKLDAAFADPTKFKSVRELAQTAGPLMLQKSRLEHERHMKHMKDMDWNMMLITVVGFGSLGYLTSTVRPKTGT